MQQSPPPTDNPTKCFLCQSSAKQGRFTENDPVYFDCSNCGQYHVTIGLLKTLSGRHCSATQLARISYYVWNGSRDRDWVQLDEETFDRLLSNGTIPSPEDQRELTILACGKQSGERLASFRVELLQWRARTGSLTLSECENLLKELAREDIITLLQIPAERDRYSVTITLKGLIEYRRILRGKTSGKRVFMAMPFSPPYGQLVRKAYEAFKGAVAETGFELMNPLLEEHRSGLIDHRLQAEIRRSRFLIADLTGKNLGAYWEAGFAQGLGKIVVYTCEDRYFKKRNAIHFDTAHHTVIKWNADDMNEACIQLASLIRNDFPGEAIP